MLWESQLQHLSSSRGARPFGDAQAGRGAAVIIHRTEDLPSTQTGLGQDSLRSGCGCGRGSLKCQSKCQRQRCPPHRSSLLMVWPGGCPSSAPPPAQNLPHKAAVQMCTALPRLAACCGACWGHKWTNVCCHAGDCPNLHGHIQPHRACQLCKAVCTAVRMHLRHGRRWSGCCW